MQNFDYFYKVPMKKVVFFRTHSNNSPIIFKNGVTYTFLISDALGIIRKERSYSKEKCQEVLTNASFMDDNTCYYSSSKCETLGEAIGYFLHKYNKDIDNLVLYVVDVDNLKKENYADILGYDNELLSQDSGPKLARASRDLSEK